MQDLTRFALASNLKWLLLAGLAVVALMLLYGSWRTSLVNVDRLQNWIHHPVAIVGTAGDTDLELEIAQSAATAIPGVRYDQYPTPYQPDNTRILIPRGGETPQLSSGSAVLAQNPAAPGEILLLARFGMWLPVLARVLAALALLALARWLLGQPWGQDVSWSNGAWVPTEQFGTIAGAQADPAQGIREPGGSRYMPLFWTGLLALLLVTAIWQLPPVRPFYTPLVFVLLSGVFAVAGFTALESWTRSLNFDEAGLCDTTLFGARRVPWSAIGKVTRRNINEDSQQSHDRARKRTGMRPQSVYVQDLVDTEGHLILSFGDDLEPPERFGQLLARAEGIEQRESDGTAIPDPGALRDGARRAVEIDNEEDDEAPDPALEAEFARMDAEAAERSKAHDRTMRRGWLLVISPFILFTLWLGWKAVYFSYVAERVQGTVVEVDGGELRSLTVEYRDAAGNTHRIGSDGSRAYAIYDVNDTVRVFYRADAPDNARLDLFLELWLGTMISAAITAMAAIPLLLMRG